MKKLYLYLLFAIASITCVAQSKGIAPKDSIQRDSLLERIHDRLYNIEDKLTRMDKFKLYKTENIYIFLKLDTKTGRIDLVQWSLDREKEFTTTLNSEDLTFIWSDIGNFELFPTNNMYQFLLMDKSMGRVWHVQWGTKKSEMWIRRIY